MNESNILKNNNNNQFQYFLSLVDRARYILIKRYDKPLSFHDVKMINDILYNEKNHYVEAFKEYLIYEDYNEFIKRFYKSSEIKIKLPKILIFYEKYSKIYANYTVIPESKYMYKNIKRKQKMIDQIQNNNINSDYEEDEESNEDMSNTVFSSAVINSIYKKTLTISNKSMNSKNTEQSVNNFLDKINNIENNVKTMKNKEKTKIMSNNFLGNKIKSPSNDVKINSNSTNNNINNDKKFIDILINNNSKKNSQNKNINQQNNLNQKSHNKKNNNNNLIYINSYKCKRKNYVNTFKNNNSIGGCIINANNTFNNSHNNTFFGNNYLKTNSNFPRQELFSLTCRQNFINNSNNNITDQKDNINLTNINNYCNNVNIMNNKQKNKLSLRETLFKLDKLVLSTNSSISPKILNENPYPTSSNKPNLYNNKNNIKNLLLKEKEKEKEKIENRQIKKNLKNKIQGLSSQNLINKKKIRSNLLHHKFNSFSNNNLTFLSNNKIFENIKINHMYKKFSKKKANNKYNEIVLNNNKKPENHRNYYNSRVISGNNSYNKNKVTNKITISNFKNINTNNKNYKITINNIKQQGIKIDTNKKINFPSSPRNSSSNYYFLNQITTKKNSFSKKKNTKLIKENKKKKVVNNFNIVNNIHDNSTQINIFTGKDFYKSLKLQNKSLFNRTSISPTSNSSTKSPYQNGGNTKNKKNVSIHKNILENNNNNKTYLKSYIKSKDKPVKHILNFKNIMNKQIIENDKGVISERLFNNNKKLIELYGKYFFKNRKDKINNNNNVVNNKKINSKNKAKNSNKNINISKNKKNRYDRLLNKIINNRFLKNKTNNNTPLKTRCIPCLTKYQTNAPSLSLSSTDYDQLMKMKKDSARNTLKYNNIISNLNDLRNIGIEDGNKLLLNSERNKISKIIFK